MANRKTIVQMSESMSCNRRQPDIYGKYIAALSQVAKPMSLAARVLGPELEFSGQLKQIQMNYRGESIMINQVM